MPKFLSSTEHNGDIIDINNNSGTAGQILSSLGSGNGIDWINQTDITVTEAEIANALQVTVKNVSGGELTKGTVVHVSPSASPPSGNIIEVIAADYDDVAKMPAIGILKETIANEAEGEAVMSGALSGIATGSFTPGDELYAGADGALTNTKPQTAGQLIQKIAVCVKSHASNGLIKIFGAGRSNDVPLPLYIDNTNQRVGIGTAIPEEKLHVQGDIRADNLKVHDKIIHRGDADTSINFTANNIDFETANTIALTLDSSQNGIFTGNVGIGTTSPGTNLDIVGGIQFDKQLASNNYNGSAKAFIHVSSSSGSAKFKVYKNTNTTDGYACFRIDRAYDYGSNDQMIQEVVYQRRTTTKNVKFKYEGDVATADDVYLEFYELTDGTVEAWVCHDDFAQVGVSITYFESTGDTYPTPSSGTPAGTLIHSTNPDTETPNWDSYQGSGYFSGNVGIGTTSPSSRLTVDTGGNTSADYIDINSGDSGRLRLGYAFTGGPTNTQYAQILTDTNGNLDLSSRGNNASNIQLYTSSGTSPIERMRIDSSGNVGIGTTSPQKKLDVYLGTNDAVASIGGTISSGEYAGLHFGYSETGNSLYRHSAIVFERDDNAFGDARGKIHLLNSASGSASADLGDARLTILPNGNVGIGTTSPSEKLEVNGNILVGDAKYTLTVNAPSNLVTAIVNNTIDVTFTASTTTNIDNYLVFSSVDGGDYGLISVIPPADFAATMSIIDDSFDATGTQAYRVYAVKNGVYSSPLTGSIAYSVSSAEPTNMSVVSLNSAYYVQWDPPSSNARFVTAYNVYKHEHATQGSLSRSSATLIYSGLNTSYMYQINGANNTNFHQFWVETTIG